MSLKDNIKKDEIDLFISQWIKLAKQLKLEEDGYLHQKNYKMSEQKRNEKRHLYTIINDACPHNRGRGTPSYWNDGVAYCYRCGSDGGSCLTNSKVDGEYW